MREEQPPGGQEGAMETGGALWEPARAGLRGRLGALVAVVALVALVAAFGGVALARLGALGGLPGGTGLGPVTSTSGWQVYHDPLGLFAMRVPPGWQASGGVDGNFTMGNRQGSFSGQSEAITFSNPAQGEASALVGVHADQINSDFGRQWYCSNGRSEETSSFNGYRAQGMWPDNDVWLFESTNAHFQVGIAIPGVMEPPHTSPLMTTIPPTPTPLPAATVQQDRTLLASSLASLQPAAAPLSC